MRLTAAALTVCALFSSSILAAPGGSARVRYVGGGAAYVDRGAKDGLAKGSVVSFKRGRSETSCVVEAVADRSARCTFADKAPLAAAGDRGGFKPVDPADGPDEARPQPAGLLPDATLEKARSEVLSASLPKVVFPKARRHSGGAVANRFEAGLRLRSWTVVGSNDSTFVRPAVDVGVRGGLPFVPGLYASSSLRVQGDILAPGGERFRNSVPAELYVWDAAVGLAPGSGAITGSVGRFRPQKAPGMTVIDGALVGFAAFGGALEVGGYGGLIPDPITTAPSFDRVVGGAYFGLDVAPTPGLLLLPRARVGLLTSSDLQKTRAEAEVQLQTMWTNALAVGASVRVGLPGDTAVPAVDAARIDVDVVPLQSLRLRAGWRLQGSLPGELDGGVIADGTTVTAVRAAQHGDAAVQWSATDWLVVGGSGAIAIDDDTGDVRGSVGPELAFPQALGPFGGLSLGYAEEPGTTAGRSAFVQSNSRPLPAVSWTTRISYFEHQAPFLDVKGDGALREALLMTFVDAPVLPWLSLRGRMQGLFDIVDIDGFGATPVGLLLDLGVTGTFL